MVLVRGGGGGGGGEANNSRLTGSTRLRGTAARDDGPTVTAGAVADGVPGAVGENAFVRDRRFDGGGGDAEERALLSRRPPAPGREDRPLADLRAGAGAVRRGGAKQTAAADEWGSFSAEAGADDDFCADCGIKGDGEAATRAAAASAAADAAVAALTVASNSRRYAASASSRAGGPLPSRAGTRGGGGWRVMGGALRPSKGVAGSE